MNLILLNKFVHLLSSYTFDLSALCTQVQGGNCINNKTCFVSGETIHSLVCFIDVTEPINIRYLWYNEFGTLLHQYDNTGYCCGTQIHVSSQTAAFLGSGNFFIEIQVALASDPDNYVTVDNQYFSVFLTGCGTPTNLNSPASGHSWISLEWGDAVAPAFADKYRIEFREGTLGPWQITYSSTTLGGGSGFGACPMYSFDDPTPPAQNHTLVGLKPCTNY